MRRQAPDYERGTSTIMTAIISWIITFVAVLAAVGIMPGIRAYQRLD
jgi:hypothetical protein